MLTLHLACFILFSCFFRLKMTAVALFRPPAAPALLAQVHTWHWLIFLLVGVGLLSLLLSTMVCLLALLHGTTNTEQRSTDAGRITAGHGLLAFLRSPTPSLVAVAQGGNSTGDICDKETEHLATPTSEGTRLRPDGRLTQSPIVDTHWNST
jgi:hypothetical protein